MASNCCPNCRTYLKAYPYDFCCKVCRDTRGAQHSTTFQHNLCPTTSPAPTTFSSTKCCLGCRQYQPAAGYDYCCLTCYQTGGTQHGASFPQHKPCASASTSAASSTPSAACCVSCGLYQPAPGYTSCCYTCAQTGGQQHGASFPQHKLCASSTTPASAPSSSWWSWLGFGGTSASTPSSAPSYAAPTPSYPGQPSNEIWFYDADKPYYEFTNFYALPQLSYGGMNWSTSEHLFQGLKFWQSAPWVTSQIQQSASPRDAFNIAQANKQFVQPSWFQGGRDQAMTIAVTEKFRQNPKLLTLLKSTGNMTLVEHTTKDDYWGDGGGGGRGQNRLGQTLMQVRSTL